MNCSHLPHLRVSRGIVLALIYCALLTCLRASPLPPDYPDARHVYRGCRLSALTYLAQFNARFPHESSRELEVTRRGAAGAAQAHTVALITWSGTWWFRDEYLGVVSLGWTVDDHGDSAQLRNRCEAELARRIAHLVRFGMPLPWDDAPDELPLRERIHEVFAARQMLPLASTLYWVQAATQEIPLLFFRPSEGHVAVYDPSLGTAEATTSERDDTQVVASIAQRLGYPVTRVRADATPSETSPAGIARTP